MGGKLLTTLAATAAIAGLSVENAPRPDNNYKRQKDHCIKTSTGRKLWYKRRSKEKHRRQINKIKRR